METKINIAEILRNKPHGIKLYSPIFGDCTYCYIHGESSDICVKRQYNVMSYFNSEGLYHTAGECLLFPSKEIRDWNKFFNNGDVLVCYEGKKPYYTIFYGFEDNTYQTFNGKFAYDSYEDKWYQNEGNFSTITFHKLSRADSEIYIKKIEERFGGKMNLETLEIEKTQPEFKVGDIVVTDAVPSKYYSKCIFILKGDLNTGESRANSYVFFNINNNHISYDVLDTIERYRNIHLATDSEKQQLFDALAKEGKTWDAEKKQIVDLKPKAELKPFDKVLVRDYDYSVWKVSLFGYKSPNNNYYYCCNGSSWIYCIPYEGNEHLLGTTNNVED